MTLRALFLMILAGTLLVLPGCGPDADTAGESVPDEAVQSDEAAPSVPSPEDSL